MIVESEAKLNTAGISFVQGEDGTIGSMGMPGVQGPRGFDGVTGPRGMVGERGDQGPIGEKGMHCRYSIIFKCLNELSPDVSHLHPRALKKRNQASTDLTNYPIDLFFIFL